MSESPTAVGNEKEYAAAAAMVSTLERELAELKERSEIKISDLQGALMEKQNAIDSHQAVVRKYEAAIKELQDENQRQDNVY